MLATRTPTMRLPVRTLAKSSRPRRASVAARAGLDTNFFVNAVASTVCVAMPAAVAVLTSEDTDAELKRLQSVKGAAPFAAAVVADTVAHSIPGKRAPSACMEAKGAGGAGVERAGERGEAGTRAPRQWGVGFSVGGGTRARADPLRSRCRPR